MENLSVTTTKPIIAVPFCEDLKERWNTFIEVEAINSTFLHSRKFYDHNSLNSLDDASLMFFKGNRIVAVFPAVLYVEDGKKILHSHLRSTYGGIIVSKHVNVETALELVRLIILFAREKKVNQVIIRNPFRIFQEYFCDETNYAMWFYGFKIKSRELEMAIPLNADIRQTRMQYHSDVVKNLRKSQSLTVYGLNDLKGLWILLERSLLEKHGVKPVHDYESIKRLIENVGKEKFLCLGSYYRHKLIGGCIVFLANNRVLHGQYIAADKEYAHLMSNHALIDHIVEYGCNNGFQYFNLGMANEDEGRSANYGLFSFKEHFGARGVLRETMHLTL
ncbi:GNAT family N-acetyltransferase [Flavihumibacter sp. R14]|nr:GNAT family N-acetyltransferase [Flavihumibacter soli]